MRVVNVTDGVVGKKKTERQRRKVRKREEQVKGRIDADNGFLQKGGVMWRGEKNSE